jgi:tetratricopeptide (TPR) repeat protein
MSDSPNPKALLDRARLLGNMGRYEQAEVFVNQCLEIDPKCAEAYSLLSLVYKNTRRIRLSIDAAKQSVALSPNDSHYHSVLTIAYKANQLWEQAEQSIDLAIQLNPNVAFYFAQQAETYIRQDRLEEAIESTKRGLKLDPKNISCLHLKLETLLHLRLLTEAKKNIDLMLSLYPNDAGVHYCLGNFYQMQNKIREAIPAYQESLRLDPLQPGLEEAIQHLQNRKADLGLDFVMRIAQGDWSSLLIAVFLLNTIIFVQLKFGSSSPHWLLYLAAVVLDLFLLRQIVSLIYRRFVRSVRS